MATQNDETSKEMVMAILEKLKELEFLKTSKALEKEILKRFSLKSLPSTTSSEQVLILQKTAVKDDDDDAKSASSGSSSSSSSSSSDDDSDAEAKKSKSTKKVTTTNEDSGSDADSESSDDEEDDAKKIAKKDTDSSSDSSDDDDDTDDDEPPKKKTRMNTPKKTATDAIVSPVEDDDGSDSDSDVSDVDVSSVSTVSSDDDSDSSDSDSSSSGSSSSEDEVDMEAMRKAKRKAAAVKAIEASKAAAAWTPKKIKKSDVKTEAGSDGAQALSTGKPFQRVDDCFWGEKAEKDGGAMADNSYGNVFGNDGFGAKSSEKLLQVRGKKFQHEKTKRKRSFNGMARNGGKINMVSNSTKYQYNSD